MRSACETDVATRTAHVRPAGEIQKHEKPDIDIGEALRASGEKQRNTIRNFILDLRGEALVVEVTGAARLYRAASVWTAGLGVLLTGINWNIFHFWWYWLISVLRIPFDCLHNGSVALSEFQIVVEH